ncbi:MAG: YqgE/AlgH family protein [Actinobacteria bacterium]|nr:YqgE/AlgH family protein [Actinomycetota bacterium]
MTTELLKGRLLVATPALGDPNFDHTVVLVLEHADDGAVGVVLNRPSETALAQPLPGWHSLAADPPLVFLGGPVSPEAAICLGRGWSGEVGEVTGPGHSGDSDERDVAGYEPLFGLLGTVDLSLDPDEMSPALQAIRVFVGYAGWGEGQLEEEIEAGAWFVVDAHPDDALSADPDALWQTVLRRQGGRMAMFANFPPNPAMN